MASWREAQSSSVIEGQVVTGEVQPPARYAVRGFSVLAKFIRVLLFFVLLLFQVGNQVGHASIRRQRFDFRGFQHPIVDAHVLDASRIQGG